MKKMKITTPENIEIEYRIAGVGSRGAAAVIDFLIQMVTLLIVGGGILLVLWKIKMIREEYYGWLIAGGLVLYFVIYYGYFILFEQMMNGQSPGKKKFKLRVIRDNGQPVGLVHSLIRNLFRVFLDMYGVGVVSIFLSKKHKRIGDYVASTIVLMEQENAGPILMEVESRNEYANPYQLPEQEYRLLKEYLYRKKTTGQELENVQVKLGQYFANKLEQNIAPMQYGEFLEQLL
jgi:uncharacterized RDD family membrane protein YckC